MDNFRDYLWYLLWSPLKRAKKEINTWYKLVTVFGRLFDQAQKALVTAREEGMIATCSPAMLPVHAADRNLTRYTGETDGNYRRRIANYPEICRLGGTNQGIILIVKSLGFPDIKIERAVDLKGDPNRWAEFFVVIPFPVAEMYPIGLPELKRAVRQTKEVAALDRYLFQFYMESVQREQFALTRVAFGFTLRWYDYPCWDGGIRWDGKQTWSSELQDHPIRIDLYVSQGMTNDHHIELEQRYHYRTWDGSTCWDGNKQWDAEIIREVL